MVRVLFASSLLLLGVASAAPSRSDSRVVEKIYEENAELQARVEALEKQHQEMLERIALHKRHADHLAGTGRRALGQLQRLKRQSPALRPELASLEAMIRSALSTTGYRTQAPGEPEVAVTPDDPEKAGEAPGAGETGSAEPEGEAPGASEPEAPEPGEGQALTEEADWQSFGDALIYHRNLNVLRGEEGATVTVELNNLTGGRILIAAIEFIGRDEVGETVVKEKHYVAGLNAQQPRTVRFDLETVPPTDDYELRLVEVE